LEKVCSFWNFWGVLCCYASFYVMCASIIHISVDTLVNSSSALTW
jgi:hypothetical protein